MVAYCVQEQSCNEGRNKIERLFLSQQLLDLVHVFP